jgi:hypothetical protein
MTFVPLPFGVRVAIQGVFNITPLVNIFHVDAGEAPNPTNMADILDAFRLAYTIDLLPYLSTAYTVNSGVATDVSQEGGAQVIDPWLTGNVGQEGGSPTPSSVACVITWRTDRTGRSYRGRTYIGGMADSGVVANTVQTTPLANINTFATNVIASLGGRGYNLVVASYRHNKAALTTAVGTPIRTGVANSRVDTQRRRLP